MIVWPFTRQLVQLNQANPKGKWIGFAMKSQGWRVLLISLALILAMPVLTILGYVFVPAPEVWAHLRATVLADYVWNTLWLVLGVGIGVLLLGVPVAWLNSLCDFPGQRIFEWALLLPMALPAYIIAYTYTGVLDFAGPVQSLIRFSGGWGYGEYWFPEIRSLGGAILMLSLVLFPYVYLLARAAFLQQSVGVLEVSRTLGLNAWQSVWRVALPLARPAIMTGLSLAMMETLADFGTVQYFAVPTFTTGIFRTWFGLGDSAAASQLAALLMSLVFMVLLLEQWARRKARYHHTSAKHSRLPRYSLRGPWALVAVLLCALPLALGFIIPVGQLLYWSMTSARSTLNTEFIALVQHSLLLAGVAALIALLLALILAYGKRIAGETGVNLIVRLAGMGYAVPGTVIAVGVLIPLTWLDQRLDSVLHSGLWLSGTVFAVLFAYQVRFLAVSLQTVEAGLGKIKLTLDNAGRVLGLNSWGVLRQLHLPLMRGTLLTAILLVFVDVLKELPATLILRPFNFNTLAVKAYELASDERLADAGLPALLIVAVGIIPVVMLSRSITKARAGEHA